MSFCKNRFCTLLKCVSFIFILNIYVSDSILSVDFTRAVSFCKQVVSSSFYPSCSQSFNTFSRNSAVTFLCLDLIWCSSSKKQKLLLEDTRLNGFTCIYSRYWRDLNIRNWKIAFHCNTQDQGPFLHRVRNEKGTSDSASRRICTIQKRQGTNPWNRSWPSMKSSIILCSEQQQINLKEFILIQEDYV